VNAVGIVTAMVAEARFLGARVSRRQPRAGLRDAALVQLGGVGPEAAAAAARELVAAGASALVSWGMAGGLDPALRPGSLVLPGEILSHEGAVLPTSAPWCQRLGAAIGPWGEPMRGRLLTSPRPIASVAEKERLFRDTGAAAVDMESYAIAQIAAAHGVPFIAVRVIIDAAQDAVPRAVLAAMNRSGEVQIPRLLAALARAPADLIALLHLARRYRAAGHTLTAIARSGALVASACPDLSLARVS